MSGAIPLPPFYAFVVWTCRTLPFFIVLMMSVSMEQHMHIKFCATLEKAGAEMYQMAKTTF